MLNTHTDKLFRRFIDNEKVVGLDFKRVDNKIQLTGSFSRTSFKFDSETRC